VYEYPFDKGYIENFKDVFGQKASLWLYPTPPDGDGIYWKTVKSTDGIVFFECELMFVSIIKQNIYLMVVVFFVQSVFGGKALY
jgi:hypothetical protein